MIGKEGLAYAHHLAFHGFLLILECKLLWDAFRGIIGWDTLVFSLDIRCTSACHENTFCPQLTLAELSARPWVSLREERQRCGSQQSPRGSQVLRVVSPCSG